MTTRTSKPPPPNEAGSPNAAPPPPDPGIDAPMKAAIGAVAITALVLSVVAALSFDLRAGLGVAIGGAIATANLLVFSRIGQAFLGQRGNAAPWAVIAVIKLVALLGGVWLILRSGFVSGLALTIGYGSLPIGITLGSLFGPKPPETPLDAGTVNRRRGDVVEAKPAAADEDSKEAR